MVQIAEALFTLGDVQTTKAAEGYDVRRYLLQHTSGHYGEISRGEARMNEHTLKEQKGQVVSRWLLDGNMVLEITTGFKHGSSAQETLIEAYPVAEMVSRAFMPRPIRVERMFDKVE